VATDFAKREVKMEPQSRLPVIIVAAVVVLGGAAFAYLERSKPAQQDLALTPDAKAYVRNLKLADVEMKGSSSYFNQVVVEIDGKIENAGDRDLGVVEIYCTFYDAYGQLVLRKRLAIVNERMGGLKPGESKSFRLPFDEIPESWNHAMPQLVIAGIRFR
jgi:Protein of unknown function (DUF3426)